MTEDKRKIAAKRFEQLALSPKAIEQLALPPELAKAIERIGAQSGRLPAHVQQVRTWLAREKREIAARQQAIASRQQAVNQAEAWLARELGINAKTPPPADHRPKPAPESSDATGGPQQIKIAQALRELDITPDDGMSTANIHRRLVTRAKDETKRTGKTVVPPSLTSVARFLGRRKS